MLCLGVLGLGFRLLVWLFMLLVGGRLWGLAVGMLRVLLVRLGGLV